MNATTTFALCWSSTPAICSRRPWRLLHFTNPISSNVHPRSFLVSSSLRGRRRHSGKNMKQQHPSSSDQRFEFVINVDDLADRASMSVRKFLANTEERFNGFVSSGKEAFGDLKTLVVVDADRRVIISCRRSSLWFLWNCVVWGFVIVFIARFVVGLMVFGIGGAYSGFWIRKRDRSLGGREVVVGRRRNDFNFKVPVNPLSPARGMVVSSRDEEMVLSSRKRVSRGKKLPKWWPDSVSSYSSAPTSMGKQEQQKEAQRMIRAIMDNRMSGKDITEDDIIRFRQVCRTSGARVNIETTNARDSFYRASVDFVLNSCSRCSSVSHSMDIQIDGEDPRQFIAGLADNIGLENTHASRIVSAAVAARTRSYFLQAWALVMQSKHDEALIELSKICHIYKIFPPEESSPEMEMVAQGLSRHLSIEQRELLLNLLSETCDAASSRIAAEALGLAHGSSV